MGHQAVTGQFTPDLRHTSITNCNSGASKGGWNLQSVSAASGTDGSISVHVIIGVESTDSLDVILNVENEHA